MSLNFLTACIVILSIIAHIVLQHVFGLLQLANLIALIGVSIGSLKLIKTTVAALLQGKLVLDYIAISAIIIALYANYYLVATVIVLMLVGGYSLEDYGVAAAKKSLTRLVDRIPHDVHLWKNGQMLDRVPIETVQVNQSIFIRKGEIIPLDGILTSDIAITDESALTGEPYMIDKLSGDPIRSGTINAGDPIIVRVTVPDQDSTYRQIINMVKQAKLDKSPLIRLADRYSLVFTLITASIAAIAFWVSHDLSRVLAVLVIATPCPLILATPIALLGGVSAASQNRIIIKRLESLEILSRANALVLDKTGTITLGKPKVKTVISHSPLPTIQLIGIAEAIERTSLHPLAKAVVAFAKDQKAPLFHAHHIQEKIGYGISGEINGATYRLSKTAEGMSIGLFNDKDLQLATFVFEDQLKGDAESILKKLSTTLQLFLLTGDKQDRTQSLLSPLNIKMSIEAECSPERKKEAILALKQKGLVTAMVGDGINDAPALAFADVGMVFSHEEQTASTEAADVVFLGGDLKSVSEVITISQKTLQIAHQCIWFGIGASMVGMGLAAAGMIIPIFGAVLQEFIDIIVILNALRASLIRQ